MRRWGIVAVTFGVFGMASMSGGAKEPAKGPGLDSKVVHGNTAFAFDLYGQLTRAEGNLFFSPYSISTAFAMTYAGARGPTAEEMAKVLHFPPDAGRLHPAFAQLIEAVNGQGKDRPFQLSVANALWGQKGFDFLPAFLDTIRANYGAGLREVDFRQSPEEARQTINRWVEEQTQDKIKDLLGARDVGPATRLVLTNAIYFKAAWAHPFAKSATKDEDFLVMADKKVRVPLMHEQARFKYLDAGAFQLLELPYEKGQQSMLVFLPKQGTTLAEVERSLDPGKLDGWLAKMKSEQVNVALPRFKFSQRFELGTTLAQMGMAQAFSAAKADFSGMDGRRDLFIGTAIHQAFVDVNEEGTEAAAATAIGIRATSAPTRVIPFRADHPFVFAIRDQASGSILFLGRVVNPQA